MHSIRAHHFLSALIILGFTAFAVADIVSGSSSVGSSSNVTITQLSITKPSVVAEGDVLLAGIAIEDGSSAEVNAPEGWTLIERTSNDSKISILSYWKVATPSEPASYLWEITPQTRAVGGITAYSGVDVSDPVDVVAGASGHSKTAEAPSVTTTADGAEVITLFAFPAGVTGGNHFGTPAGMTEKYDTSKSPGGPSLASHDVQQAVAGESGTKSSLLGSKRNWVAQTIVLRPTGSAVTADDFDSYTDGDLNGLNGGTGWTSVWTGDVRFDVQGSTVFEGSKAITVNVPAGQQPSISRSFAPKTTGVLHWVQRKDGPDDGASVSLQSGDTSAIDISIGSGTQPQPGGPDWVGASGTFTPEGHEIPIIFQPYTIGSFDEVDLEFNTVTDQYRISFNGDPYTEWKNFRNPVDSVDTLKLYISSSGFVGSPSHWDDIRFNN